MSRERELTEKTRHPMRHTHTAHLRLQISATLKGERHSQSCWLRSCRQVTSSDSASRAMMVSLMDTHGCLTQMPACRLVASPSLLELQLLPVDEADARGRHHHTQE